MSEPVERTIKVVWVPPGAAGPGGHRLPYMAYFEGEEIETHENPSPARAWGQTIREAEVTLRREPSK